MQYRVQRRILVRLLSDWLVRFFKRLLLWWMFFWCYQLYFALVNRLQAEKLELLLSTYSFLETALYHQVSNVVFSCVSITSYVVILCIFYLQASPHFACLFLDFYTSLISHFNYPWLYFLFEDSSAAVVRTTTTSFDCDIFLVLQSIKIVNNKAIQEYENSFFL